MYLLEIKNSMKITTQMKKTTLLYNRRNMNHNMNQKFKKTKED